MNPTVPEPNSLRPLCKQMELCFRRISVRWKQVFLENLKVMTERVSGFFMRLGENQADICFYFEGDLHNRRCCPLTLFLISLESFASVGGNAPAALHHGPGQSAILTNDDEPTF